jgi:hypothetical protein
MNELHFAFRPLLKNSGFIAVAVLTLEIGDRTHGDRQSRSKSNRLLAAMPPRGNSTSLGRTRRAHHFAGAPDAGWDGPGSLETSGKQGARPPGCRAAVDDSIAKTSLCPARSRVAIELGVRSLRKGRRIALKFRLRLVEERAQGRARARVADYPLPRRVAVQFRQERGQIRDQFLTICRSQISDGGLDFLHRVHGCTVLRLHGPGKFVSRRVGTLIAHRC